MVLPGGTLLTREEVRVERHAGGALSNMVFVLLTDERAMF
jgi:hypothetical protein